MYTKSCWEIAWKETRESDTMCSWKAVAGKTQKWSEWGQETTADVTLLRWNWSSVSNCSYFLGINYGSKMGVAYTKTIYVFKCKCKATQLKNNLIQHCSHGKVFAWGAAIIVCKRTVTSLTGRCTYTTPVAPHGIPISPNHCDRGTMDSQGHIILPSWGTLCSVLVAYVRMLNFFCPTCLTKKTLTLSIALWDTWLKIWLCYIVKHCWINMYAAEGNNWDHMAQKVPHFLNHNLTLKKAVCFVLGALEGLVDNGWASRCVWQKPYTAQSKDPTGNKVGQLLQCIYKHPGNFKDSTAS